MKRSCHICKGWYYPHRMYNFDTCKTCMFYIKNNKKINYPQGLLRSGSIELV